MDLLLRLCGGVALVLGIVLALSTGSVGRAADGEVRVQVGVNAVLTLQGVGAGRPVLRTNVPTGATLTLDRPTRTYVAASS